MTIYVFSQKKGFYLKFQFSALFRTLCILYPLQEKDLDGSAERLFNYTALMEVVGIQVTNHVPDVRHYRFPGFISVFFRFFSFPDFRCYRYPCFIFFMPALQTSRLLRWRLHFLLAVSLLVIGLVHRKHTVNKHYKHCKLPAHRL